MMNPRSLASSWLAAVCLFLATDAVAQETVYNVELIIFRVTAPQGGAENWSAQTSLRSVGSGAESGSAAGTAPLGRLIGTLPPERLQLGQIERRLRTSGAYEPVAHVGWSQTASPWGTRAGFSLDQLGVRVPGLSGTVFLERGQYLHLGMTLSYTMSDPPPGLGAGSGTTFTLSESRRVRLYDRNYYDHPAFGVIALVTPAQGSRPAGR